MADPISDMINKDLQRIKKAGNHIRVSEMDAEKSLLLTFTEAQQFLRISHQTLYNLVQKGLPSHKIAAKRMFLREELIQWIKQH